MAENEVNLKVKVTAEGVEKIDQVDKSMGKLGKTTSTAIVSTNKVTDATTLYNTSLTKAYPQMEQFTPLMGVLGMNTLLTAGGFTLLGLGVTKLGQQFKATQGDLTDVGVAINKYSMFGMTGQQVTAEMTKESNLLHASVDQVSTAFNEVITNTRDIEKTEKALDTINKAALATGKSLSFMADVYSKAWTQGTTYLGKPIPPGQQAAEDEMKNYMAQHTQSRAIGGTLGRKIGQFFDINNPATFLGGLFESAAGKPGSFWQDVPAIPRRLTTPAQTNPALTTPATVGPTSITVPVNIDGQKVAGIVIDIMNGQVRGRGAN